jgi:hypothetical protein
MGSQFGFFPSTGEQPLGSRLWGAAYMSGVIFQPSGSASVLGCAVLASSVSLRSMGLRGSSASVTAVARLGNQISELGIVTVGSSVSVGRLCWASPAPFLLGDSTAWFKSVSFWCGEHRTQLECPWQRYYGQLGFHVFAQPYGLLGLFSALSEFWLPSVSRQRWAADWRLFSLWANSSRYKSLQ